MLIEEALVAGHGGGGLIESVLTNWLIVRCAGTAALRNVGQFHYTPPTLGGATVEGVGGEALTFSPVVCVCVCVCVCACVRACVCGV